MQGGSSIWNAIGMQENATTGDLEFSSWLHRNGMCSRDRCGQIISMSLVESKSYAYLSVSIGSVKDTFATLAGLFKVW